MHLQITDLLPPIAFLVSYLLQQEQWPKPVNMLIAAGTILAVVAADLWIQGMLTGNPANDILVIVTATLALQAETFIPLQKYLRANGFSPPDVTTSPPPSQEGNSPTPILLPPAAGQRDSTTPPSA